MTKRFPNILLAVDSRQDRHPALQWAARLAKHNQAKLKIFDVLPDLPWIAQLVLTDRENTQEALVEQKRTMLEMVAQPIRDQGVKVTTELLFGENIIRHHRRGIAIEARSAGSSHEGRTQPLNRILREQ